MRAFLQQFYDRRYETYSEHDPAARIRYRKAMAAAGLTPNAEILDIACRDAMMLELLESFGSSKARYTGVDISEAVLKVNRARHPDVRFVSADVSAELPFEPQSFDRIFALEILEHVPQPLTMLENIRRVLKPSGRLVVSVPNPYYYMEIFNELRDYPDTEGHLFSYGLANIRLLFDMCGFEVESISGTYFEVPKKLRGAYRDQATWFLERVPMLVARSRIFVCRIKPGMQLT